VISVLILARNEEANLPHCLEAVRWADEVVVLDDSSTDGTVRIAREFGARVVTYSAGDEREQRTYSIRSISFRYPWVFNPDADEICTPELAQEMRAAASDARRSDVAFRVRFRTMFMGRWVRFSSLYPTWVIRLFRPERLSFERSTNLRYVVDGPVGLLQGHFVHYSFNKGFDAWFDKHNVYSRHEAQESLRSLGRTARGWGTLCARDPVERRRALKELSFRLPFRPTLRFMYMYLLRLGFLDGAPGLAYCRLLALYEYMIVLKMREIRRREQGLLL
jgi:glycosyltransferase involved in cell wall biosynthesis